MTGPEVMDVARDAIVTLILVTAPLMLVGLIVGVAVSLVQALTQIQEATLVFVPKILAIFVTLLVALPFMADTHVCELCAHRRAHRRQLAVRGRRERAVAPCAIDLSFLPALGAAFLLVFARIGTMLMLLPGLGEQNISARMRLTFALILAATLLPLHRDAYHIDATALGPVLVMLVEEILIGAMLGVTARLTISALEVAGSVIAQQLGLGFVTAVDPTQGEQGMIVGNFLTLLGITLFFATDMHHLVIAALNDSYTLFEPGELPTTGDAAALITKMVAGAFRIGIQLSAPFIVFGLLFNIGLGILARLMPQMQVFFVGLPLSILIGLLFLLLLLGAMMSFFLDYAGGVLHALTPHG